MEWQGLNQLYEQYRRELLLYLYSLCRSEALAEDLLQETFLKAYFSLAQSHTNVRAWLYLVARNLYFDWHRKSGRLVGDEDLPLQDGSPGPEEKLLTDERYRALYRALDRLDERKREVLVLQYFGGLSHKEIAALLKIRPDYVGVLGCRAKKELREWLKEDGYELP